MMKRLTLVGQVWDTLALTVWAPDGSVQHVEPASTLGGGSVIVRSH